MSLVYFGITIFILVWVIANAWRTHQTHTGVR